MKERYKIAKMLQSQANDKYFAGLAAAAVISCTAIAIHLFFALQGGRITADDEQIVFRIFCFSYAFRFESIKNVELENFVRSDTNLTVFDRIPDIYEILTITTDSGQKTICSRSKPDWDSIADDPTSVKDHLEDTCFRRVKRYIEERTNE